MFWMIIYIFFVMIPSITFVLSLNCDIFISSIVIPVYVSDISFIYLFHIIAVLCESKYFVMHIFSLFYLFT